MSDVEFDEENKGTILYGRFEKSRQEPKMISWIIKSGMAKSESQANIILLAVVLICIIIAIFVSIHFSGTGGRKPAPLETNKTTRLS